MGAQLVREVASKTSDIAGDGTTTATVLAEAIYKEGLRNVTAGCQPDVAPARHPQGRRRPRQPSSPRISTKVTDSKEIAQVATVSANWDTAIGNIIADAMDKVGKDGTITVEEAKSHRNDARRRRRHAVRQGLHLALLRDQFRDDGSEPRQRLSSSTRRRSPTSRTCSPAREGRQERQARSSSSLKTWKVKPSPRSW